MMPDSPVPAVSVIIPVWNSGPGIERCINSLRNQILKDIEMIFKMAAQSAFCCAETIAFCSLNSRIHPEISINTHRSIP